MCASRLHENTKKGIFVEHFLCTRLYVFVGNTTFSKIDMFPALVALFLDKGESR